MIEWKNVKDELPKESGYVLVYYGCGYAYVNFSKNFKSFNVHDWYSFDKARDTVIIEVTHWAYVNKPEGN